MFAVIFYIVFKVIILYIPLDILVWDRFSQQILFYLAIIQYLTYLRYIVLGRLVEPTAYDE